MASVKQITRSSREDKQKFKALGCGHFRFEFDTHAYCPTCREKKRFSDKVPPDPCVLSEPCPLCDGFSDVQKHKIKHRRRYLRKDKPIKEGGDG